MERDAASPQHSGQAGVEQFRKELGPFVVAAVTTRMPMLFTDGQVSVNPIVFANDAFLALTGFTRAAVLGAPISLILGDVTDAGTASSIQIALALGNDGSWEMQCRRADQSEFLASVFHSPVRDEQGTIRQNFLSFVELSGPIDRLLDQKDEFHALYENAPGFIATSRGPEHHFTFVNASYRRFVGREHLVGLTVAEALPEIVGQGLIGVLDEVYRTGETFVGKDLPIGVADCATAAITTRYADFVYQAVRNSRGDIIGLFCEGYDVTAQHETMATLSALQSELIHVSRVNAMGTMATALAHELNQPLSAITNYAVGIQRLVDPQARDASRLVQALQGIEEASKRAAEIISNLRELTRRRQPARGSFNLKSAVGECVRLVRATTLPEIQIVDHTPGDWTIAADRIQIQQVIINLVRNACDAVLATDRRKVSIVAERGAENLTLCVIDTGVGVPIRSAECIFSWSESSKEGGMGLGLSICRTIIEAHHGRIWLENSSPHGSEFCFSLPLPISPTSPDGEVGSAV